MTSLCCSSTASVGFSFPKHDIMARYLHEPAVTLFHPLQFQLMLLPRPDSESEKNPKKNPSVARHLLRLHLNEKEKNAEICFNH